MVEKTITFAKDKLIAPQKRGKKEPKRDLPKERKIIGWVLLASVGLSALFYLSTNKPRLNFNFKLPSFSNSSPKTKSPRKRTPAELEEMVFEIIGEEKQNWAIWVEDLEDGFSWGFQEKEIFPAASLIKLPTITTLYQQIESGEYALEQELTLTKEDIRGGAGSLNNQPLESKITLEQLAHLSLNQSDNTAFNMIRKLLTDQAISRNTFSLGLINTSLEENVTTAQDIALFFKLLYKKELFAQEYTDKFINHLTNTAFENQIPKGVPVKVAHKVGIEIDSLADAGLLLIPEKEPIILVFLTKDLNQSKTEQTMQELAQEIYWFLVSKN